MKTYKFEVENMMSVMKQFIDTFEITMLGEEWAKEKVKTLYNGLEGKKINKINKIDKLFLTIFIVDKCNGELSRHFNCAISTGQCDSIVKIFNSTNDKWKYKRMYSFIRNEMRKFVSKYELLPYVKELETIIDYCEKKIKK